MRGVGLDSPGRGWCACCRAAVHTYTPMDACTSYTGRGGRGGGQCTHIQQFVDQQVRDKAATSFGTDK
jgi:hypothetical protein